MPAFKIISLYCFLVSLALASKCPQDAISKLVVCYYKGETSLTDFNICNCTHLIFTNGVKRSENNSITATEDTIKILEIVKDRKDNLTAIFTLETKQDETSKILKSENKTENLINGIVEFFQDSQFDGIELDFKFRSDDGVQKDSYSSFVKGLSKTLSHHRRVKRDGYDVFEKLKDDVTTASYTTQTPKNSTSKTQTIKRRSRKPKQSNRKIREKKDEEQNGGDQVTLEEAINAVFSGEKSESRIASKNVVDKKYSVFVRLSIEPEIVAKKYDLKILSRYADILSVPTHNIVNSNEEHLTYHPSRLMGLSDILNTDSILDFLTGMGALKSKMVISFPATVLKFQLKEEKNNTPRSPSVAKPRVIDQSQLCLLFSKNNWTIERDDDLTAPYAFSRKTWLAFEDEISVNIKGKYILLRELAGGAIYPIDADLNDGPCNNRSGSEGGYLSGILHKNFQSLERKPRALVLESLQEEIHDSAFTNTEAGVRLSEYRIVRVVDHSGAVHVVRKNTKTQFECSRQGYFSHPLGCNKFYRCVKFDQYSDEFTVFEYDCPAGLAFDERWEVCVWPGSLPHGAPCTGSSEIAPVPRSHYQCPPQEGYYSDPENCRWFFACLDHARDGITPLTAYEFRCPFGLVFSEVKLACDWPWLVGSCGNRGSFAGQQVHSATFINGGNLEASFGQYSGQDALFAGFGKRFEGTDAFNAYQGAQTAGFGYIASQFEDNNNRAAFAAFPEYEISGGRILNKGGVVLEHNVAGIATGGLTTGTLGGFQHQNIHDTSSIKFQQEIRSRGQAVVTPKPFSVSIPSVQINEETLSDHSTTPQTLLFESSSPTGKVKHVHLLNAQQLNSGGEYSGLAIGQPTGIPFFTSTEKFGVAVGLNSPSISEDHRFGQSGRKISFGQSSATAGVSASRFKFGSGQSEVPVVTPKPGIHTFEYTASVSHPSPAESPVVGFTHQNTGAKFAAAGIPVVTGSQYKYGSDQVSVALPVVTPKPVENFEYSSLGVSHNSPTASPVVGFTQQNFGGKTSSVTVKIPAGQIAAEQAGVSFGAAVTPSVFTTDRKIGSFSSSVSFAPTLTSTIDEKVSNELKYNKQPPQLYTFSTTASEKYFGQQNSIPAVTPKSDYQLFSPVVKGKSDTVVSFGGSSETSQPDLSSFYEKHDSGVGVTPIVPFGSPQTNSEISKDFSQTIFNVPPVVQEQKVISESSYSIPVESVPSVKFSHVGQPAFGQRYSYSSSYRQSGTISPFGAVSTTAKPAVTKKTEVFLPETVRSNVLAGITVEQQPIISHGTTVAGQTDYFTYPQNSVYNNINFKSSYNAQPQQVTVTTPTPAVVSITPSPHSVVIENQPTILQQDVKSFGSVSHATTPGTSSYEAEISSGSGSLSPITERSQILLQENQQQVIQPFKFLKAKTFGEKRSEFTVTTAKPFEPQDKLVELEITKSVELNPAQIGQDYLSPPKPIVIQEQPLHLVSQKTFPTKQVIQPFYKQQEKETAQVTGNRQQEGYYFQQQVNIQTPQTEKQYLPPSTTVKPQLSTISYSTPKTVNIAQTTVYSAGIAGAPAISSVKYSTPKSVAQPAVYPAVAPAAPSVTYGAAKTVIAQPAVFSEGIDAVSPPFSSVTYSKTIAQSAVTGDGAPELPAVTYSTPKTISHSAVFPPVAPKFPSVSHSTPKTLPQSIVYPDVAPAVPTSTYSSAKTVNIGQSGVFSAGINVVAPALPSVTTTSKTLSKPAVYSAVGINAGINAVSPALPPVTYSIPKTVNIGQSAVFSSGIDTVAPALPSVTYSTPKTLSQPAAYPSVIPEVSSVTYTTPKTVVQPIVYSEETENVAPALPVFEASKIPFIGSKETSRTAGLEKPLYVDSGYPQKVNLLKQTQTDELSLQTHGGFDSQKINKYGGAVEFKYSINPNIAIPDPPEEYFLTQNAFTTVAPEISQPTTAGRNEFKTSTYLPPFRRKPSKTTAITVGSLSDDDVQQLFDQYSGRFGQALNKNGKVGAKIIKGDGKGRIEVDREGSSTVEYEISSTTARSRPRGRQYHGGITSGITAANKYEEYDINGGQRSFDTDKDDATASKTTIDLKNLKLDKNKKTVIVVSQVSDANPVLVGKLAGQCSCQSNMLELRTKKTGRKKTSQKQQQPTAIINEYLPPFETDSGTPTETVVIGGSKSVSFTTEQNYISSSTTADPVSSTILSSLGPEGVLSITPKLIYTDDALKYKKKQFRGRTRYLPTSPALSEDGLSLVPASEIASTFDYSNLRGDESRTQNEIDGGKVPGAAFDRYGPGGWRGFDETLQGSVDCKRPGLFRHPKYCNKFYACNYDPWKERYTLHVFNCPIQLTYDSSISACNWPVRGPACADDNLLV